MEWKPVYRELQMPEKKRKEMKCYSKERWEET